MVKHSLFEVIIELSLVFALNFESHSIYIYWQIVSLIHDFEKYAQKLYEVGLDVERNIEVQHATYTKASREL